MPQPKMQFNVMNLKTRTEFNTILKMQGKTQDIVFNRFMKDFIAEARSCKPLSSRDGSGTGSKRGPVAVGKKKPSR